MGFLLNFSLKSHLLFFFFDKKHKSTDWCSIEGGVPSDGENRVHCLYFAVFTYVQLAARETATFLPGIEIETATFLVESRNPRIPESQNPGILVELVESLPLFFLESY